MIGTAAFGALLGVVLLTAAPVTAGQVPPRDVAPSMGSTGGEIRGVITATDTGLPIRGAEVRLTGGTQRNQRPHGAMTDEAGRYQVTGLPPGQYTVIASKTGYVALAYGQTRVADPGRPVQVDAGAIVEKIDVGLPRGAVIVVRLADERGDPLGGYRLTAFQPRFTDGRRTLASIGIDSQYVTDDRGELRLSGLAPGEYYIATTPSPSVVSPRGKEPQTFYPGTTSETDAQPVTVGLGEEIGISFSIASGRGARITGAIAGMPQRPPEVRMMRRTLGMNAMLSLNVAPDGTFTASNLQPAEYVLTVRGESEIGMLRFRVAGEDIDGLVVRMRPQTPLRGRYIFAPKPPAGGPSSLGSVLRPIMSEGGVFPQPVAQVKSDWTFEIPYALGVGVLRFDPPARGWFLQSILLNGVDVTDTPMEFSDFEGKQIDVRLTQAGTRVSGTVTDSRGARASTYVAVVFPEDARQWTPYSRGILAARPDQQGGYVLQGVPPGRYLIAAVDYLEPGQERDAATLERLRRTATTVTLADGESRALDLKLVP
jgi:hypothetical protein